MFKNELGVILPENRSPIRLWDSRVNPRLMLHIVKRCPRLVLAESQGVEPCQLFKELYTLAGWCLTVRPTLRMLIYYLAEAVRFELTEPFSSTVFKTVALNQTQPNFHLKLIITSHRRSRQPKL